jgi:tetratricopeptide (TPR) repeat protein
MVRAGVIGTCLLLVVLVVSVWRTRALLAGWLFIFIALLPTLGVVAYSWVYTADNYLYLPMIGLLLPMTWGLVWVWGAAVGPARMTCRLAAAGLVLALAAAEARASRKYLAQWEDTETLGRHLVALDPEVAMIRSHLGTALLKQGRTQAALAHLRKAADINPEYPVAHLNLALALEREGQVDEAIRHYLEVLRLRPGFVKAYNNLGVLLARQGLLQQALEHFDIALKLDPDCFDSWFNRGRALSKLGRSDEATEAYRQAVQLLPLNATARLVLGRELEKQGELRKAIFQYRRAANLDPANDQARQALAAARARRAAGQPP